MNTYTHAQSPTTDHPIRIHPDNRHLDRPYPLDPDHPLPEPPLQQTHPCSFPFGQADPTYARPDDGPEPTPLLLTVMETARMLSLGRTKVYELMAAGELEEVHIGRAARIPLDAVVEYVERLRWKSTLSR